jgi:7,8-dihydro-6-hydroxymethylpterin-pyrophosphokinase (HPPK)
MIKSVTKFLSANYGVYACRSFSSSGSGLIETYIAIGSNVGDRVGAFKDAIAQLRLLGEVKSTSFLYETPPMYVTDQEKFLNAACHLRTSLRPEQLLSALQSIGKFILRYLLLMICFHKLYRQNYLSDIFFVCSQNQSN